MVQINFGRTKLDYMSQIPYIKPLIQFEPKQVKLMAVYGEDDIMKEEADDLLRLFRASQKVWQLVM